MLGTEEAVLDPEEKISLKKELVYVKDEKGGFYFWLYSHLSVIISVIC